MIACYKDLNRQRRIYRARRRKTPHHAASAAAASDQESQAKRKGGREEDMKEAKKAGARKEEANSVRCRLHSLQLGSCQLCYKWRCKQRHLKPGRWTVQGRRDRRGLLPSAGWQAGWTSDVGSSSPAGHRKSLRIPFLLIIWLIDESLPPRPLHQLKTFVRKKCTQCTNHALEMHIIHTPETPCIQALRE